MDEAAKKLVPREGCSHGFIGFCDQCYEEKKLAGLESEADRYREALEKIGCQMEQHCGGHGGYCIVCLALDPSCGQTEGEY